MLNRVLRDRNSPYRLHSIEASTYEFGVPARDNSRTGVLALTRDQATTLRTPRRNWYQYLFPNLEIYNNTLTTEQIEALLTQFEAMSLFSHLTAEQIESGRRYLRQNFLNRQTELLSSFKNLVVSFAWETSNIENPYQSLVLCQPSIDG